ncbi:hypothetical protein NEDG_01305 [Nematocida displodere]|uniref:Exocyst complex component Sec6 n=1 Tax=Nematocida displodere TaxID=1805483 RepID=A0A177EDJ2_9MICR|nr:hypothetical protein NEDG_01305 [Nematocida displodere]
MRASKLSEMEEQIKESLAEERSRDTKRAALLESIRESIQNRKALLEKLEQEKEDRLKEIGKKREHLHLAREVIQEKENAEREKERVAAEAEYSESIARTNTLTMELTKKLPQTVVEILEIRDRAEASGFANLCSSISVHVEENMKELIRTIGRESKKERLDKTVERVKVVGRTMKVFSQKFAGAREREEAYVRVYFEDIAAEFKHHFFGDFATNRLDKPEWYLEYLLKAFGEYTTMFKVLEAVEEETQDPPASILLQCLGRRIVLAKFKEAIYTSSRQRKELIMHHASEIKEFFKKVAQEHGVDGVLELGGKEVGLIKEVFLRSSEEEVERILAKNYTEWMDSLKYLVKNIFSESVALFGIVPDIHNILLSGVVRKYLSGLLVFLESFAYTRKDEWQILAYFVDEVMYLEEEMLDIENDFGLAVESIVIFDMAYFSRAKKTLRDTLSEIATEALEPALKPLTSYRFMEGSEVEECLADLRESMARLLTITQSPRVLSALKGDVGKNVDNYLTSEVASQHMDGVCDIDRLVVIIESIADVLKQAGIDNHLSLSLAQCQRLAQELEG